MAASIFGPCYLGGTLSPVLRFAIELGDRVNMSASCGGLFNQPRFADVGTEKGEGGGKGKMETDLLFE